MLREGFRFGPMAGRLAEVAIGDDAGAGPGQQVPGHCPSPPHVGTDMIYDADDVNSIQIAAVSLNSPGFLSNEWGPPHCRGSKGSEIQQGVAVTHRWRPRTCVAPAFSGPRPPQAGSQANCCSGFRYFGWRAALRSPSSLLPADCPNRPVVRLAFAATMPHRSTGSTTQNLSFWSCHNELHRAITYHDGGS